MKFAAFLLALGTSLLCACNSSAQDEARQTARDIQDATATFGPGEVATSAGGYEMHAVLDGKPWSAAGMMEINASNDHYVHGEGEGIQISFYIDRDHAKPGKVKKLGAGHGADLGIGDEIWSARTGEYVITRLDDAAIEGTFHFTAGKFQSDETMEVTGGTFRLPLQ